jgi:phage-related protein
MSYAAFPSLTPSTSSSMKKTYRSLLAQFGGNYAQVAPDGVNSIVPTWSLTFENISISDSSTLDSFLDGVGAWAFFTWTPPSGSGTVWRVDGNVGVTKSTTGLVNTYSFDVVMVY